MDSAVRGAAAVGSAWVIRRQRPFSLESGGSLDYDYGLRFDKQEMSASGVAPNVSWCMRRMRTVSGSGRVPECAQRSEAFRKGAADGYDAVDQRSPITTIHLRTKTRERIPAKMGCEKGLSHQRHFRSP